MKYNLGLIGKRLKEERKKASYGSQDNLANYLREQGYGITRQTIAKWERGDELPPLEVMLVLCEKYECELGFLLCEYDCKTRVSADIKAELGLSENAINTLCAFNQNQHTGNSNMNYGSLKVLNYLLDAEENSEILRYMHKYIFHRYSYFLTGGYDYTGCVTLLSDSLNIEGELAIAEVSGAYLMKITETLALLRKESYSFSTNTMPPFEHFLKKIKKLNNEILHWQKFVDVDKPLEQIEGGSVEIDRLSKQKQFIEDAFLENHFKHLIVLTEDDFKVYDMQDEQILRHLHERAQNGRSHWDMPGRVCKPFAPDNPYDISLANSKEFPVDASELHETIIDDTIINETK